jgi:hypothetical protein
MAFIGPRIEQEARDYKPKEDKKPIPIPPPPPPPSTAQGAGGGKVQIVDQPMEPVKTTPVYQTYYVPSGNTTSIKPDIEKEVKVQVGEAITLKVPQTVPQPSPISEVGTKTFADFKPPSPQEITQKQMGAYMAPYQGEAFKDVVKGITVPEPPYPVVGHIIAATKGAEIPGGKVPVSYDVVKGTIGIDKEIKPLNLAPVGEFAAGLVGVGEGMVNPRVPTVWGAIWEQGKGETTKWLAEHPSYTAGNVVGEVAAAVAPAAIAKVGEIRAAVKFGEDVVRVAPYAEIPKIKTIEVLEEAKPWSPKSIFVKSEEISGELKQVGEARFAPKSDFFDVRANFDVSEIKPKLTIEQGKPVWGEPKGAGFLQTSASDLEGMSGISIYKGSESSVALRGEEIIKSVIWQKPEGFVSREIVMETKPRALTDFLKITDELGWKEPIWTKPPKEIPKPDVDIQLKGLKVETPTKGEFEVLKGGGGIDVKQVVKALPKEGMEGGAVRILPTGGDISRAFAGAGMAAISGFKGISAIAPRGGSEGLKITTQTQTTPIVVPKINLDIKPSLDFKQEPAMKPDIVPIVKTTPSSIPNIAPILDVKTTPITKTTTIPITATIPFEKTFAPPITPTIETPKVIQFYPPTIIPTYPPYTEMPSIPRLPRLDVFRSAKIQPKIELPKISSRYFELVNPFGTSIVPKALRNLGI